MDWAAIIAVAVTLFFSAIVQRVTGMGLALMASPFLTLALGPTAGVQLLQIIGLAVCLAAAWALRASINLRIALELLAAAVLGLIPGAALARVLPEAWLSVTVGSVTLLALALMTVIGRSPLLKGPRGALISGAASGFMNVTAGVGGPPIVIYAASTGWRYQEYLATSQLYFAGLGVLSIAARGVPALPAPMWVAAAAASLAGLVAGAALSKRIPVAIATRAVHAIAIAGSLTTLVRGLASL